MDFSRQIWSLIHLQHLNGFQNNAIGLASYGPIGKRQCENPPWQKMIGQMSSNHMSFIMIPRFWKFGINF